MVLPLPGGGSKGGGGREGQEIGPPETEYGRAVYCDVTESGDLQCGKETAGDTSTTAVVGTVGNWLEAAEGEGDSDNGAGGSERGSVGDAGIGIGFELGPRPHARWDRGRHRVVGVPGSQWIQWRRVEQGGGLS